MINIINLQKSYSKLQVLQDINLMLEGGECIALIGPNGCGKTTLIKSILGMVIPSSGTIIVQNQNIGNNTKYRENIGYMPQIGKYPENMSIEQIFEMIKDIRNHHGNLDLNLWDSFKLEAIKNKRMGTLSGGTTQKVSAALAFLFDPQIYILDEPTAGLDPIAAEILKEKMMVEKERGKLILITSHMLAELDELISQIVFMQDGTIRLQKSTYELKQITGQDRVSKGIANILKGQQV